MVEEGKDKEWNGSRREERKNSGEACEE
jgi:hypothetical protein